MNMRRQDTLTEAPPRGRCRAVLESLADPAATHSLVTIHGIADAPEVWQPVCRALGSRFARTWQLELRWHMGVGEPYDYPDCGSVLREGWLQLPPGRKVVLAHSFGCNALMRMVQATPLADVDALVLLSPYYKPAYTAFDWPLFERYVSEFRRFLETSIDARSQGRVIAPDLRREILGRLLQSYSPPSWVMFYREWSRTPALDLLPLSMPCIVMTGSEDFSLPVEDPEVLATRLARADFAVLEGLGHFALIEDPAITAGHIASFLAERLDT